MEIESSFSAVSAPEEMDRQFETFTRKLSAMPSFQLFSSKENDENESEMEDLSALKVNSLITCI